MSLHVPAHLAVSVRNRATGVCEYCRLPQELQEATFHIDHVVPLATKGTTAFENLALACVTCSLRKGSRTHVRDPKTGRRIRIFNPRDEEWHRHFAFTRNWRIVGKTARGRATIAALGMNRKAVVAIRRELAGIARFPSD